MELIPFYTSAKLNIKKLMIRGRIRTQLRAVAASCKFLIKNPHF